MEQAQIQIIQSFLNLKDKRDVLKLHFFAKILEKGVLVYPNELEVLIELYLRKGFNTKGERDSLYDYCFTNAFRRSKQSFNNTITKFVKAKIINKKGRCMREVSPEFVPYLSSDYIGLDYKVVNINAN